MFNHNFPVSGTVEIFPVENPWVYVRIPKNYTKDLKDFADRGLVAVTATLGKSTWNTSLLPYGDGTQFIALNAKVRKAENVKIGSKITLSFQLRER